MVAYIFTFDYRITDVASTDVTITVHVTMAEDTQQGSDSETMCKFTCEF